jgi:menaquinone-dependent protoporphyrinogen oxidase
MNTLIVYSSYKGYTAERVEELRQELPGESVCLKLGRGASVPDIAGFDLVVAGGAVHAGRIPGKLKTFLVRHEQELLQRPLGLFLCCLDAQKLTEYLEANIPKALVNHASASACLGGRLRMSEHNFFMRGLLKKVTGSSDDVLNDQPEAVKQFARELSKG